MIVKRNANQNAETNIPEFNDLGDQPDGTTGTGVVYVNITVMQTFSMNVSTADMSVGSTQLLYGMFGEDTPTEADQFKWDPSDDSNNEYISNFNEWTVCNGYSKERNTIEQSGYGNTFVDELGWFDPDDHM